MIESVDFMALLKRKPQLIKPGSKLDLFMAKHYDSGQFTYRQIFGMLGPLIIDQFFIFFISMLTASLISSSSEASMTAVSLVGPISMIAMALFFAVSNGGTVIVAQYKGKGDENQVRRAASQVILMTFIVAAASCLILIFFARPLIDVFYPSTDILIREKAADYLVGFSLSLPAFAIFNGVFNVLRGIGDTKVCLRLTVIINVIHLIASFVFINFMKLDIMGTALAYNVARLIGCVMALIIIFSRKSSLSLKLSDFKHFNLPMQKSIVRMGIPFAIEQIFFNLGAMLCQIYMAPLGQAVIAANAIANSVSNLFYGAGYGVTTLSITVVGRCIGAGEVDLARKYGRKMIWLGTFTMIASLIVLFPLSPLILKLFNPVATTLPMIYQAIIIGMIPIPFVWSLSYVTPSILRAAGDTGYTSIVSLVAMWVFRVGFGYVLGIWMGIGLNGIWISMGAEWLARGVIFYIRFLGKKWVLKKVV